MGLSKVKIGTMPPATNNALYSLIEIFIICGTFITVCWKWTDSYFKNKSQEKEEFIIKIADVAASAAIDKVLGGVKSDIQTLFRYREDDRKHIDDKLDRMMLEIKK